MSYTFNNNEPLFFQIERAIKRMIVAGEYPAGEKIPSIREIAASFDVTPNTVQRALQNLEQENLIYTERTNGKFVTRDIHRIEKLREDVLNSNISGLIFDLISQHYSASEIQESVGKELSKYDTD